MRFAAKEAIVKALGVAPAMAADELYLQLVERLEPYLVPLAGNFAGVLALIGVVGLISYFTLVFGELAPKNLALKYPETYAVAVAAPIRMLESASYFLPPADLLKRRYGRGRLFCAPTADQAGRMGYCR